MECVFYLPFRRFYIVASHEVKWRKAWKLDPFPILNPKLFLPTLCVCMCVFPHTVTFTHEHRMQRSVALFSDSILFSWDRGSFLGPPQAYCLCLPRCRSDRYSRPCPAWDWQRTEHQCVLEQQALLPDEPSSQPLLSLILFKFWASVLREL